MPRLGRGRHCRGAAVGDGVFDYALVVTTTCFVDAPRAVLDEARRALRPGGALVIGFIDSTSTIGRHYETHREDSAFYPMRRSTDPRLK